MYAIQGDTGGQIIIDVYERDENQVKQPVDISAAMLLRLDVTRQDGSMEQWTATFFSNTQISYVIPANALPKKETIKIDPFIKWSPDLYFHGTPIYLIVG